MSLAPARDASCRFLLGKEAGLSLMAMTGGGASTSACRGAEKAPEGSAQRRPSTRAVLSLDAVCRAMLFA